MVSVKTLVVSALAATLCTCSALPSVTGLRKRITNSGSGIDSDGFYWNLWTDGTKGLNYENGPDGSYTATWGNGTQNFIGGKGWNPGTRDRNITYSAADFKTSGNAYLCVYGWAINDPGVDVEYYVVEWFGSYDPTGAFLSNNASRKVTIEDTENGGTYTIGRYRYTGMGFPSPLIKDTVYSVRERKDRRTAGTVNMKLHFDAWEQKLGIKFGRLDFQIVATEAYMSAGEARVKVEKDS